MSLTIRCLSVLNCPLKFANRDKYTLYHPFGILDGVSYTITVEWLTGAHTFAYRPCFVTLDHGLVHKYPCTENV